MGERQRTFGRGVTAPRHGECEFAALLEAMSLSLEQLLESVATVGRITRGKDAEADELWSFGSKQRACLTDASALLQCRLRKEASDSSPHSSPHSIYLPKRVAKPKFVKDDTTEEFEMRDMEKGVAGTPRSISEMLPSTLPETGEPGQSQPSPRRIDATAHTSTSAAGSSQLLLMHPEWSQVEESLIQHYLDNKESKAADKSSRRSSHAKKQNGYLLARSMSSFGTLSTAMSNMSLSAGKTRTCRFAGMMHPASVQVLVWDSFSLLFLTYDVLNIPLLVFYFLYILILVVIQWMCAIFWTLDMAMTFRTGFLDGTVLQMESSIVANRYMRTWFPFDVVIVVNDWVALLGNSSTFYALRALRVVRLLRIAKLLRLVKAFEQRIYSNRLHLMLSLMKVIAQFVVCVHFITCLWFWLGSSLGNGWTEEAHMAGKGVVYQYFAASRWTIAQISGRTDMVIRQAEEYMFTVAVCIFGLVCISVIISSVTNTMIELGSFERERKDQLRCLLGYLNRHRLSPSVAMRAKSHFVAQLRDRHDHHKEMHVLKLLSKQLLMDLFHEIRAPVVTAHPYLFELSIECPRMIFRMCSDAIHPMASTHEEVLFTRGDACSRVLFIESGTLTYYLNPQGVSVPTSSLSSRPSASSDSPPRGQAISGVESDSTETKLPQRFSFLFNSENDRLDEAPPGGELLRQQQWVSEAVLWIEWQNKGTLVSMLSGCQMLALEAPEFIMVVKLFKDAFAKTALYARHFVNHIQNLEALSDVM